MKKIILSLVCCTSISFGESLYVTANYNPILMKRLNSSYGVLDKTINEYDNPYINDKYESLYGYGLGFKYNDMFSVELNRNDTEYNIMEDSSGNTTLNLTIDSLDFMMLSDHYKNHEYTYYGLVGLGKVRTNGESEIDGIKVGRYDGEGNNIRLGAGIITVNAFKKIELFMGYQFDFTRFNANMSDFTNNLPADFKLRIHSLKFGLRFYL